MPNTSKKNRFNSAIIQAITVQARFFVIVPHVFSALYLPSCFLCNPPYKPTLWQGNKKVTLHEHNDMRDEYSHIRRHEFTYSKARIHEYLTAYSVGRFWEPRIDIRRFP